jgi:hypothetical protein
LYIGNGFKSSPQLFFPQSPQMMLNEPEDKQEQHEPREEKVVETVENKVDDE